MRTDGAITFSTAFDNAQLEKGLARLKTRILKLEVEIGGRRFKSDVLKERINSASKEYERLSKKTEHIDSRLLSSVAPEDAAKMAELEEYIKSTEKEILALDKAIDDENISLEYMKQQYGELAQQAARLGSAQTTEYSNEPAEAVKRLKDELQSLEKQGKWFGDKEYDEAYGKLLHIKELVKDHKRELAQASAYAAEMADSAGVSDQRIADLGQELETLQARMRELKRAGIGFGYQEYDNASARIAEINRELKEYKAGLSNVSKDDPVSDLADSAQIADQRIVDLNRELLKLKVRQAELEQMGLGLGHEEYDQVTARMGELNGELKEYRKNLSHAADGAEVAAKGTEKISEASKRAGGYMNNFGKRLKGVLASAFIFNILSSGLRQFTAWAGKSVRANDEARAAIARLKGALLTLAQPLVEVVIPAFTLLVNILAQIVTAVAQFVSMLFGKTLKQSKDGAKSLYKEANAIGAVGAAADEAAGSLAGFDEINPISTESAKGAGSGGGIGTGDKIAPDFSGLIGGDLDKITAIVGAALLALGAILTFSGANIPLGLALMVAGAVTLASAIYENWGVITEKLRGPIGLITALVSGALLALGALLLFSGVNIPLGLALIAAGAIGLAAVVAANWESLSGVLNGPIGTITSAISVALLALGALLAFSGVNIPLGLALIAAGAVGLVASIAANWDSVQQALEGPTGAVTGLISGLLLALGAILLFSGANIPLGLGLLVVGAIGLATSIAANWETIQKALQGPVGTITAMVSGALLVLGAILAFSGAALPLGIGLMAVGAVGLVTAIAANWNTVENALKGPIGAVTAIVSAALLVLGIILLFTGAGIPLGLGLMAAGAVGLAATVAPNWDFVLDAIKKAWGNVKTWWSANAAKFFTLDYWKDLGKNMIDGLLKGLAGIFTGLANWASNVWSTITGVFSGKNAKASVQNSTQQSGGGKAPARSIPEISTYNVPALARGAVIPPNREFMAVLGDQRSGYNVEAPADLIKQMVIEGIQAAGISNGSGQPIQVNVMLDKRVLARAMVNEVNDMTRQAGKPVLLI